MGLLLLIISCSFKKGCFIKPTKATTAQGFWGFAKEGAHSKVEVMSVRLLVAEDHILMRHSLTLVLGREPGWEVVGEASDGGTAVRLALALEPDVVVMDVALPQVNGVDATRRILEQRPQTHIVALSIRSSKRCAAQMLRAGARAYVLKDDGPEELVLAIQIVRKGRIYLSLGIDPCDS